MRAILLLLTFTMVVGPTIATGQTPRSRADSLEAELRALTARIDSLQRVVERLLQQGRDTAEAVDDLAALRAAARRAAGTPDSTVAPPEQVTFASQTRSLNRLNPEISATGDVRLQAQRPGPQEDNIAVREFEFSFRSALDPYASTKIFIGFEDGEVGIEEGYLYWTGLPGHLRVDLGRFRQQIGELNRWHSHALPESEYPLVLREYLGEEGLVGDGISLFWLIPAGGAVIGTHELTAQVSLANNEVLFDEGRRLAYLAHLNNFWALSPSTFVQIGGTALYGQNPDTDLRTSVFGADLRFTWRPPAQAQYRSFTLRAEGYAARRQVLGVGDRNYGGFVGTEYQLSRRLFAGARFDYVELLDGGGVHQWALVPRFTWWQSEWVYLRAEWQHHSLPGLAGTRETADRFLIQAVWAIGPHKHENY